ncbi:hypothetical protein CTEN210_01070 [Chaetoceros tenuissimus]|uniref:Leucine-rich repeat domain-containing protein n=1 Tax=Chaetoceros tenuissimus TaxID=426638 RepID=A0AAD3GZD3_9STRA|nr:hypothetical protein CTEN210_01070 [Chaetoceros tenuissimus]
MRVQTEEWRRFIPGVRMYKGKKTLFYNGEILWDRYEYLVYDQEERNSWEVIIVLPGVEEIPADTFSECENVKVVIMGRIEDAAFSNCWNLAYVRLSRNLEFIGEEAFRVCESLTSIFIPPSCRWIGNLAFERCSRLIILSVPQETELGRNIIADTALLTCAPATTNNLGWYGNHDEVNEWIKTINGDTEEFALHRACLSYNPITDIIYGIVKRQGLNALKKKNEAGISPLEYLEANPFAEILDQRAFMKRYVLDMMGEVD